ncbi:MAG: NAD-glutamate dehydrogenase [Rhodospirillales bacterium]|nr:NAD-glutamate dehydrogenase [Rhodospirillales bacterium]
MAFKTQQLKSELIDKIEERVHQRLEPQRAALADRFIQQFYANVPPDDILHDTPDNLYGAALALLAFAKRRKPGEAKIRVYSPRLEEQGWKSAHTIVEVINDDMPFLVDSVTAELHRLDAKVHLVIHPILPLKRAADGRLTELHEPGSGAKGAHNESVMHVQVSEQPSERHELIREGLAGVLADVRAAVEDWPAMRQRCREVIAELIQNPPKLPREEIEAGIPFLEWLDNDHFTYLGYREYHFEGTGAKAVTRVPAEGGLGVLRDESIPVFEGLRNFGKLPVEVRDFLKQPQLVRITKANRRATVHRRVHMDTIAVKSFDKKGKVTGERLFLGLFTSVAYSRSPREIPLLREKVARTVKRAGFAPSSHDAKALAHILDNYPRDELFQISEDELFATATGILHLQERQRVALFVRRDPFERFVSALVFVPRDRYDTNLRLRIQDVLARTYDGSVEAFNTHLTDAALARLHIIVKTTPGALPEVDLGALEIKLVETARSWVDDLEESLVEARGEEQGVRGLRRFAKAFPANYQDHFNAQGAVFDITRIEEALETGQLAMNLYRPIEAEENQLRFKIYVSGDPVPLSDVLPMLENMGLKVIGEVPYEVHLPDLAQPVWIHDFDTVTEGGAAVDLGQAKEAFHDSFARVWRGEMENDGFNKLVLRAGLTAREVKVLRAYCKYLRQAGIPFSQAYMEETLQGNPQIARRLADLFVSRFDPAVQGEGTRAEDLVQEIQDLLEQVSNLDEDRIIRRFLNVIEATLRTNFFQEGAAGGEKSYISFKLNSQNIEELPLPRPFREIFVYSPRVEGVHLRFGKVARGGLRWSDRREDFRTEVLGLVKAQQVKNAVIVPVGSKGGFVVKRPPAADAGREGLLNEGIECYKTFLRGLLDITDNLKGAEVVPPRAVVRHDEDDPYLVVAADKGTATFSDIANGVSAEYGFWLDDAFASGGSAGYDHKKMAITARGAWESVKRHFREIGKDIQNEDFTCVGVGDMAGDVFGNGMLLSKHIKLIGAFNHLHIFIDPDPDPAASWAERKRLFDLPRSAWSDYDAKLISKGGGVFERRTKAIKLTPQIKKLFGIERDKVTPSELIAAMLKADAELLWFGGIGTYVKASYETHADVGDRANDALRVDATDLRAKVVGEGANLGVTQRARIEYDFRGGRCNTDSIDNSAGVDCSDHEVNIKILLGDIEAAGDMTRKQRDQLLRKMTDEVADLVLRDNYLQTQAITVTHQLGAHLIDRTARFMRALERVGQLDRAVEYLPDDETIAERQKQDVGFARAELAVLQSYAKIVLYEEILSSDLPDDLYLRDDLIGYFPGPLRKTYQKQITSHRLRREIVATVVTNELVNRVGLAFIHEAKEKTGMPAEDIARAYMVSRAIFGIPDLLQQIESLDNKVSAAAQSAMLMECGRLVERGTVWFLREAARPLDIRGEIESFGGGVKELAEGLEDLLSPADREATGQRAAGFIDQGVPEATAHRIASLGLLAPACDIVRIARNVGQPAQQVAKAYFDIGARFGFDWLRRAAGHLPTDTAWDKLAVTAVIDDLFGHQAQLTQRVLEVAGTGAAEHVIEDWAESRRPLVARTEQLLAELQSTGTPDFAMLAVANRQLKTMVGG